MSVIVMERIETLIEPSTEGRLIADELEEKLRLQGAFRGRKESTNNITLTAEYYMTVNKAESEGES